MSNNITIELCQEDRARLDRLAEALERQATIHQNPEPNNETESVPETNPIEPPQESLEDTEVVPPIDEPAPAAPSVDRAELRAKVIELSAKGLKDQTRDIVRSYGQTVTAVPDDKVAECYAKLVALEVQ